MTNDNNYYYLDFNVTGSERRRLVKAISDFTFADAKYQGAPTFAYTVDCFTIDRNGVVTFNDGVDSEEIDALLETLVNEGFVSQVSNLGCEPEESENESEETALQDKNSNGGIDMDAYFKELTRRLNSAGIQTAPPEKDRLPILWNGEAVIFVSPSAHTWIQTENVLDDAAKEMYYKAADIAQEVREYVTAVEQAPPLKATGLDNEFHRLAGFNEVVLAGRELPNNHGYQFVTWGWNESQNSLYHGHYYEDDYARAKEDFAARSGLVQKDKLFSDEQLTEVFRAVEETLESAYPLTTQRRDLLERVCGQIRDSVPDLQNRVMRSNEAEYAVSLRLQGESQSVDEPDGVEIYWQDLTPAKQAEILRVFGENGNWDVIPIATLEVPEQTEIHGMDMEGM